MITIAQENAKQAGLLNDITFKQLAAKDFKTDKPRGVIVANPPYGKRLGELDAARKLYREMGQTYAALPGWSKYILTADLGFEKVYGSKAPSVGSCITGHCGRIIINIGRNGHHGSKTIIPSSLNGLKHEILDRRSQPNPLK